MITPRSFAKIRARRRARSAGAVLFIVVMTVVVLGSMGAYAMRAASTEARTSGYARASTQTRYLTEYGALGIAHALQGPEAQMHVDLMTNPLTRDGAVGRPPCNSLAALPITVQGTMSRACQRIPALEASLNWTALSASGRRYALDTFVDPVAPGSFGARIQGNFVVEITEPMQGAQPAGYDQALGLCFTNFAVTATAVTFPTDTSGGANGILAGQSIITGRARVTGGPIRCPR